MRPDPRLETYWIDFPDDPALMGGIGVTAYSEEDAFSLIQDQGLDQSYAGAKRIRVTKGLRITDLDQTNIVPNIGPMQLRGVWYPAANTGFGAPQDTAYKPLKS